MFGDRHPISQPGTSTAFGVPRLLFSMREAAEALAVCERTVGNLIARGELRAVRIGRAVRVHLDDLTAFIVARKG